jgi:hypothetical protein
MQELRLAAAIVVQRRLQQRSSALPLPSAVLSLFLAKV